jgi:hypothetical protein
MSSQTESLLPRLRQTEEERFERLMDELDVLAAVLQDIDSEEIADAITMWIDYMIYRALYESDQHPECAPEARECRKLIMAHLDKVAWSEPALEPIAAS